jgi:hypothetical protein
MSELPDVELEPDGPVTQTTVPNEGTEQATNGDASDDADEAVEAEALAMGWKPRTSFKGPEDKFVSAAEYVERGKTIMPFLRNELKRRDREIEGLKKSVESSIRHISKAEERAYVKAKADLEAELEQYTEAGNKKAVKEVTDDLIALETERATAPVAKEGEAPPPEFDAWLDNNPWYGTGDGKDEALSAACDAIGKAVHADGYTGKAQIKEVDRRLREEYPHKFKAADNPNRRQAAAVEGAGAAPRARGKGYADLPPDAKAMCDELVRDKILTREQYVKTYDFGA